MPIKKSEKLQIGDIINCGVYPFVKIKNLETLVYNFSQDENILNRFRLAERLINKNIHKYTEVINA